MATHDYVIANGTGQNVRQDLNDALAAIVSNNSGSSEPATTYAYQWWADTTANVLKIRNSANNAWITLRELDGTMLLEDGSAATPGLAFAGDVDTGIFRSAANTINFATSGAERLEIGTSAVVFNDSSNDVDFRVESNGQTHMLFVDGGKDAVGIATTPEEWESGQFFALQIGKGGALYGRAAGDEDRNGLTSNCYHSSAGWKYIAASAHATRYDQSDGNHIWFTAGTGSADAAVSFSETARIDTSGRLLVGTSSTRSNIASTAQDVVFERASIVSQSLVANQNASGGSTLSLCLSRGTSVGSNTVVQSGDTVGVLAFRGNDGTNFLNLGMVKGEVDGTPGSNDMPGRLTFFTTADGDSSPTERLRITNEGHMGLGETSPDTRLHIKESTTGGTGIFIQNSNGATNSSADLYFGNWNGSSTSTPQARLQAINTNSNTAATDLAFWTYSGSSTSEKMRLTSSGELGLGISSPAQKLHVDCGAPSSNDKIIGLFQSESARQIYMGWDDSQSTMVLGTLTNHPLAIHTNGQNNERIRIDSNGLKFNGDTAAANALNDYERGTFTPAISFSNLSVSSYDSQQGSYIKVGKIVHISIYIRFSGSNLSGTASTGGSLSIALPFTAGTGYNASQYIPGPAAIGRIGEFRGTNDSTNFDTIYHYVSNNSNNLVFGVNKMPPSPITTDFLYTMSEKSFNGLKGNSYNFEYRHSFTYESYS